jgi:hypothetical protein
LNSSSTTTSNLASRPSTPDFERRPSRYPTSYPRQISSEDETTYIPSPIPPFDWLPHVIPIGTLDELTQFIDEYEREEGYQSNVEPTLYETARTDTQSYQTARAPSTVPSIDFTFVFDFLRHNTYIRRPGTPDTYVTPTPIPSIRYIDQGVQTSPPYREVQFDGPHRNRILTVLDPEDRIVYETEFEEALTFDEDGIEGDRHLLVYQPRPDQSAE